jgi:hypothetical protein
MIDTRISVINEMQWHDLPRPPLWDGLYATQGDVRYVPREPKPPEPPRQPPQRPEPHKGPAAIGY